MGSAVTIFTPDSTHYDIARYAIERGHHVLLTKPATKLLAHHLELLALAETHNVFVYVEHHKRFDLTSVSVTAGADRLVWRRG